MRRGATLSEVILAITILGLLLGISLPRMAAFRDSLAVDEAAHRLQGASRKARVAAILTSQIIELTVAADSLVIRPAAGTVPLWRSPGPSGEKIALSGGPKRILFSPVGIAMGVSNASFRLTRGTAARTVVVSRLGRVRILR